MTENDFEGTRQDPAEPNQLDESVDTSTQPEDASDVETGGEAEMSAGEEPVVPEEPQFSQTVSPSDPAVETKTINNQQYEVTPDGGHRLVQEPAEVAEDDSEVSDED